MEHWLTASEIVEFCKREKIGGLPTTAFRMRDLLQREGFSKPPHARKRTGVKRAPLEYRVSSKLKPLEPVAFRLASLRDRERKKAALAPAASTTPTLAKRSELEVTRLNDRQRQIAEARSAVLNAVDLHMVMQDLTERKAIVDIVEQPTAFGLCEEIIAAAQGSTKGGTDLNVRTLQRWMQFRRDAGIGGLAPKSTKQKQQAPDWFWDFLPYFARPQKPCITEALDDFLRSEKARGINDRPTYSKVRRLVASLGNVEKHRGREGSLTLKSRLAYTVRSTADLLPSCVYTADGKTFDALVAHPHTGKPFRPEITSVVDVATRKCVGWSVGLAENSQGVRDALRIACQTHGVCAIFYTDNGAGFKNDDMDNEFTGLLARMGVTKMHSLPYNSQARGIIERFNGSVWNPLARCYDSYFNSRMDRQALQLNFKMTRKDLKEFGTSKRIPSWEEFRENCNSAIEEYNNTVHSSLPDRMTPCEYWDWHVENGFEAVTLTQAETDDLFRTWLQRRVQRCMVTINKNTYFNIDLTEFNGEDVVVGCDPHDAKHVWVRRINETEKGIAPGELICVAVFAGNEERYIPQSLQDKAMEKRTAARTKRLEEKLDDVRAESRPALQLKANSSARLNDDASEYGANHPANSNDQSSLIQHDVEDAIIEAQAEKETGKSVPKRRTFRTDAELANWAIEHPQEVSENQRLTLLECLRSRADRDLLELEGVDLTELKAVVQNVA
jgi:putative transposase